MVAVAPGTSLRRRALALTIGVCVVLLAASMVRGSTAAGGVHSTSPTLVQQGFLTIAIREEDAANAAGTVTVTPPGVTCPPSCDVPYEEGATVTLTTNPDPGSFFYRWDRREEPTTCDGSNFEATCILGLTGSNTLVDAFFLPNPALAVGVTGKFVDEDNKAAVNVSVAGAPCVTAEVGEDACYYPVAPGSTVTLTPINSSAGSLVEWSVPECPGTGECRIVIDSQLRTVVATFSPLNLNVLIEGNGTVTGGQIDCPGTCSADFPTFTDVTLTASSPGFRGWNGACEEARTSQSCTIRLSGGDVVGAWFEGSPTPPLIIPPRIPIELEVKKTGDGTGNVTSARSRFSETINCGAGTGCDAFFQQGERAALVADPAAGSAFAGWETPGNLCSSTLTCRFEVMRASRLTARFVRSAQPPPPPPPPQPPPPPPQPPPPPPPPQRKCSARKVGGPRADRLDGGPRSDAIFGRGGNDRIRGLGGNDCLFGEGGNDVVSGGPGSDAVSGGRGADQLHGGPGRDTIKGERGRDRIFARDGARDVILCGRGRDNVRADRNDRVSGCEFVRK